MKNVYEVKTGCSMESVKLYSPRLRFINGFARRLKKAKHGMPRSQKHFGIWRRFGRDYRKNKQRESEPSTCNNFSSFESIKTNQKLITTFLLAAPFFMRLKVTGADSTSHPRGKCFSGQMFTSKPTRSVSARKTTGKWIICCRRWFASALLRRWL